MIMAAIVEHMRAETVIDALKMLFTVSTLALFITASPDRNTSALPSARKPHDAGIAC
jgi:hypothetical protein